MKRIGLPLLFMMLLAAHAHAQPRRGLAAKRPPEKRVALVIGNGAYDFSPLANPINDARDMARLLGDIGFNVIHKENLGQTEMKRVIREFGARLRGGGVGLFYFAGHGVQVRGANYLIPVGAEVGSEEEIEYEAVEAGFVLAQMEAAGNETNIVILDACRNNPFPVKLRSGSRGLAQMDAPTGTIIAYATAPGDVASDGAGRNGLYTQELLKVMRTPNLAIEEVFKRVRKSLYALTRGKQVPWESSSLVAPFYFSGEGPPADSAAALEAVERVRREAEERKREADERATREQAERQRAEQETERERAAREAAEEKQRQLEASLEERRRELEALKPRAEIKKVWVETNVDAGMKIHVQFEVHNLRGVECELAAYFYFSNGEKLKDFNKNYNSPSGHVAVGTKIVPDYDGTRYEDVTLFIPYSELHMPKGAYDLKFDVQLHRIGGGVALLAESDYTVFTLTTQ